MVESENIRVVGRFRPLNERERALEKSGVAASVRFGEGGRTVWVGPDAGSGNYTLDAVLPPEATQQDIYNEASGLVDAVMQGYNSTLLAYGQVLTHAHGLAHQACLAAACLLRRLARGRRTQ